MSERFKEFIQTDGVSGVEIIKFGPIFLDIVYISRQELEKIFDKINKCDFHDVNNPITFTRLSKKYSNSKITEIIHRMLVSKPILNDRKYIDIKNSLNIDSFFQWRARISINFGDNVYDDIAGLLEVEEFDTALFLTRSLIDEAATALCFAHNTSLDRPKWLIWSLKKIRSTQNAHLVDKYFDVLKDNHDDNMPSMEALIEKRLDFFNLVTNYIQQQPIKGGKHACI